MPAASPTARSQTSGHACRRAAEDDHGRSLSGMVVRVLQEWLTTAGYFGGDDKPAQRSSKQKQAPTPRKRR